MTIQKRLMISRRTPKFRQLLTRLPKATRKQAYTAYRRFKEDPFHESLHFKRVGTDSAIYSVRIGLHHRALGQRISDDEIVWFWIGTHADYDKLLSR